MRGILFMLVAILLLSCMDALAKWLMTTHDVSAIQILAIRSIIIVPLMLVIFSVRKEASVLKPKRLNLHIWRGCIGFISPLAFFLGIKHIPLTDAIVLFFSSIFIVTILSVFVLKEKVGVHRWASIFVGFIGVLIVATPEGGGQLKGYLLVLLGSAAYSMLFVSSRYLSSTESVASMVFSYNACVGVIAMMLLPWFWQNLNLTQSLWLVALSLLAVAGHYCITMAFASSEASLVAPFEYSGILWGIAFDYYVWHTLPAYSTLGGATIIIASGLYIVHRERVRGQAVNTS